LGTDAVKCGDEEADRDESRVPSLPKSQEIIFSCAWRPAGRHAG